MLRLEQLRSLIVHPSPWVVEELQDKRYELRPVPLGRLARTLQVSERTFSEEAVDSVFRSSWFVIDDGRMVVEVRNPVIMQQPGSVVHFIDFDDCLMSATGWHRAEYAAVAASQALARRGIAILPEEAKSVYEMSKIEVPGKVKHERRYTPHLNLILLSELAAAREKGVGAEDSWEYLNRVREYYAGGIAGQGEGFLAKARVDADIVKIFFRNRPARFVYEALVSDLLFRREANDDDVRVIATRGKIEGFLGQVYKLHESGVMGMDVDMVIYSNDIKVESLLLLSQLLPWMRHRQVRVFDDNSAEIYPYRDLARQRGIRNVEIIRVRHPDAKRKDEALMIEPDVAGIGEAGEAGFDYFFPLESQHSVF